MFLAMVSYNRSKEQNKNGGKIMILKKLLAMTLAMVMAITTNSVVYSDIIIVDNHKI